MKLSACGVIPRTPPVSICDSAHGAHDLSVSDTVHSPCSGPSGSRLQESLFDQAGLPIETNKAVTIVLSTLDMSDALNLSIPAATGNVHWGKKTSSSVISPMRMTPGKGMVQITSSRKRLEYFSLQSAVIRRRISPHTPVPPSRPTKCNRLTP